MFRIFDFLAYCFITAYTPGANNILAMTYASQYGFRKSFRFNLGITTGFFIVMVACTLFTAAMHSFIPKAEMVLKVLGAAYMLYLGWKVWRSSSHHGKNEEGQATFLSGMLLQFVNVKIYIYAITAMSLYILPVYSEAHILFLFVLLLTAIGATGNLLWSLFGNVLSAFTEKHEKATAAVMAALLVYCAVALFI